MTARPGSVSLFPIKPLEGRVLDAVPLHPSELSGWHSAGAQKKKKKCNCPERSQLGGLLTARRCQGEKGLYPLDS